LTAATKVGDAAGRVSVGLESGPGHHIRSVRPGVKRPAVKPLTCESAGVGSDAIRLPMPHLTMAHVAARAGVCKATVSLALRHDPRIPAATVRRIERIATELGYTRHPIVDELMSELRRSRTAGYRRTIALLNAHPSPRAFTENPTIPSWVEGCRRRAAHLGYTVDEFWLHDPELDAARLERILAARAIRGVIVIGGFGRQGIPERFASLWQAVACVVTGVRTRAPTLPFTSVDHHHLVLDAIAAVRELGYQRPALVINRTIDQITHRRFSGAAWLAQQDLPAARRIASHTEVDDTPKGREAFLRWFKAQRPDVLLTLHPILRTWLEEIGVVAPRDIGFVHLERNRQTPDWAGMDQHNDIAGEAAVDMLTVRLQSPHVEGATLPRATLIGATWVPGKSVRRQDSGRGVRSPGA